MLAAASVLCGCASQPYVTDERLERGLVIVLPGIEGRGAMNEAICRGLNEGAVNWAIQLYDWTSPLGLLYNLRAEVRNRQKALTIADRIMRYNWEYPGRPVMLVGHSGGGAIAAWVAEALPRGARINGLVMIAPSLSPQYMLDWALANTRMGVVNFHSSRDWILLGMGTTVYGTMDGEHTSSAGRVGFQRPEYARDNKHYRKLFQVAWNTTMSNTGHFGGHFSSSAGLFVAKYVAPLVLATRWNEDYVREVMAQAGAKVHAAADGQAEPPAEADDKAPAPAETPPSPRTRRRRKKRKPVVSDVKDGKPLPWDEFDPD